MLEEPEEDFEDEQEEEVSQGPKVPRLRMHNRPKTHCNKFLQQIKKNVEMAENYDPKHQDRPAFRFMGVSGANTTKASARKAVDFLRDSEMGDEIDENASIPARFLEQLGVVSARGDTSRRVRPTKRKRRIPSHYDYNITALTDKHVDKFRVQQKLTVEQVATNTLIDRHNKVF